MDSVRFKAHLQYTFLILVILAAPGAHAELAPFYQAIGQVSISVDAMGTIDASGTVDVDKPPGSTVRKAFLISNSNGLFDSPEIANGDVSLAGTPVVWDAGEFNGASQFFHNVYADVTDIVAPIIDAASPGINSIAISEARTNTINGEILVVVFNDPSRPSDSSIILLFGGQETDGDTFLISLAEPVPSDPEVVDFGIGVGHGFQGDFGTDMVNLIDVNGARLTSSAGGEDDGAAANGALITVGGIGDSRSNPPPFDPSTEFRTDDELYDLRGFLNEGDEVVEIFSVNPTDDDNIHFAYLVSTLATAVAPPLDPPGEADLEGTLNPNLPTIVLTHGLQDEDNNVADLWTGFGPTQAGGLIQEALGQAAGNFNIVQYVWEGAFQPFDCLFDRLPDDDSYIAASNNVVDAGVRLASLLAEELGASYDKDVHFIGHSLGTAVNSHALSTLLDALPNISAAQFTALDRPHHLVNKICGLTASEEAVHGFDGNFFSNVLPVGRSGLDLRIDNYFALEGAGVGDMAFGPIYNHPELINPNDLDNATFGGEGVDNNHSGVQQWYRWTVNPVHPLPAGNSVCTGGVFSDPPFGYDDSLDPCEEGWNWSLFGPSPSDFPEPNGGPIPVTADDPAEVIEAVEFGCDITGTPPAPITITCEEEGARRSPSGNAANPFAVLEVAVPEQAVSMSFEYNFISRGSGDYAAVFVNEVPVWILSGESVLEENTFYPVTGIPLGLVGNQASLKIVLYSVGTPNAAFALRNLSFQVPAGDCTPDATTLCLPEDNRFEVKVHWETAQGGGGQGDGFAVPLDSLNIKKGGIFYFRDPENPEFLVKIINGCGLNNRYWVFYAATTNVGFDLTVRDTEANAIKVYTNPDVHPASTITDTQAFATCP